MHNQEKQDFTHEEVFGGVSHAYFSEVDAADYLEIHIDLFRQFVRDGKLVPASDTGLFHAADLRTLKKSFKFD